MTGGTDSVDVNDNKIQRNPVDSYVKMEQIEGCNGGSTSESGRGASETLFRSSSTEASSRVVKKEEESWDSAEVENAWRNRATLYDLPNPNTNDQHFLLELAVDSNPETPEASSLLKRTKKSTVQRPKNRKKAGVGSRSKRSSAKKVTSSSGRQSRKRKCLDEDIASATNIHLLPTRSSVRLRKKRAEQVDYSHLPPKYVGPASPSIRYCDYVLGELMSSKHQSINCFVDLATVRRKLFYKQYANAAEFADEIRTLCMNPINLTHSDECRSLLEVFEEHWLHLPPESVEPTSTPSEEIAGMDEDDRTLYVLEKATQKALEKTHSLIGEVTLQEQHLTEMKAMRENAKCNKKIPPPVLPAVWGSVSATLAKCGSVSIYERSNLEKMDEDSTLNTEQDGANEPLPHMEQVKLAEDLRLLDDNEMGGVVDIILEHDALTVGEILNDDEPEAIIKFKDLKPITLRKVATYVESVLTSTSNCANNGSKNTNGRSKKSGGRKKCEPTRKRTDIVDIEARKRELMEEIKKLGGTGITKPMKKRASFADYYDRVESAHTDDDNRCSSSSSTSISCQSSSSSDTVVSENPINVEPR